MRIRFSLFSVVIIIILSEVIISGNQILIKKYLSVPGSILQECPDSCKEMTVQGTSMYPFIKPGDNVKALFGYYSCHDIQRNDVVLFNYSGNKNPLIKFVRAVPGDKWSLKKVNGIYEIVINGVSLINSEGKTYQLTEFTSKMLKLYAKDYPTIPSDVYLLLGDKTEGSLDSSHFGLVSKKEIIAKIDFDN